MGLRAGFLGWQLSCIASFISGAPLGIGFGQTVVTGNPVLPKSERTFSRNFCTEVFGLVAIFMNFPTHEQIRIQFRAEMYDFFNHTQFNALDTTARFDPAGRQVNARNPA